MDDLQFYENNSTNINNMGNVDQTTEKNTTEDNLKTENDVDDQLKDEIFFLQQLLNDQNSIDLMTNVYLSERSTINQNLLTTTTTSLQQQIQNHNIQQQVNNQQNQKQIVQIQNQPDPNNNQNVNNKNMNFDFGYMQVQVKKLHKLYLNEQDKITKLQKRLQESENQRLNTVSENNKIIFGLNSQFAKMRAELEKSEAIRQSLEYELSVFRNNLNKERSIALEKEKLIEDVTRSLEEKNIAIINENDHLKSRLEIIEGDYGRELDKFRVSLDEKEKYLEKFQIEQELFESERQTLNKFVKEQERINSQLKDENHSHIESISKLSLQIETYKEKEELFRKENEALNGKIKLLEENYDKEKIQFSDLKTNFETVQLKHNELQSQLRMKESLKSEIELNMAKLIEQLKENRKELSEEQGRNREIRERFKICDGQFKLINNDLSSKLEEKSNTIKTLSLQLSSYESNLDQIKDELKQMEDRQNENDKMLENFKNEIDSLTRLFQIKHVSYSDSSKSQRHQHQSFTSDSGSVETINDKLNQFKRTMNDYKKYYQQMSEQLKEAKKHNNDLQSEFDLLKQTMDSKEKVISKHDDIKVKHDNEMRTLRKEHVALEEVIHSLRVQCDTLKASLTREYETNESLRKQMNQQNSKTKTNEEEHVILRIIQKKLQPIYAILKIDATIDSKKPSFDLIDNLIDKFIDYIKLTDKKLTEYETKIKTNDKSIEQITRKYDEQLQKTLKLLKEKEIVFNKQKESLVNYYEQLINDVNARVKHTQSNANDAWDKLKNITDNKKTLESDCTNYKDALHKSHTQIRNLNTSCSLLLGILEPLVRHNKELVEQRNMFCGIYLKRSAISSQQCDSDTRIRRLGTFRKAVLAVLALNRLVHFRNLNSNTKLNIHDMSVDQHYQFLYSNIGRPHGFCLTATNTKLLAQTNDENDSETDNTNSSSQQNSLSKKLFNWFTSNNHILTLIDISHEINRYLYGNDSSSNKFDFDESLVKTTKQSIIKFYSIIESTFTSSLSLAPSINSLNLQQSKDGTTLCQRLKLGLNKLLNRATVSNDQQLIRKQFKGKTVEDEIFKLQKNRMAQLEKFETVCKELDLSLKREKQAEILLNKQSLQLEELSKKLAHASTNELHAYKIKEAIEALQTELQRKEKLIRSLNKKLNETYSIKETVDDTSTRNVLFDKDIFLAYCQNIENLIQNQMKPLLLNDQYRDVLNVIKQINNIEFTSNDKQYIKPSIEAISFQNVMILFCDNYEIILRKMISSEDEIESLRKQLNNIKEEFMIVLRNDPKQQIISKYESPTKYSPSNTDLETSDISFRQLPNFSSTQTTQHTSAFKPLPVRLMSSSTPTSSSLNS